MPKPVLALICCGLALLLAAPFPVHGETRKDPGLARLESFLKDVTSLQADFTQQVVDAGGKMLEESSGRVSLQRPGRFRWDYLKPFERVIVADGSRIWLYEADLEQVTVRKLDEGIGATPAALLTGRTDVLDRFRFQRSWQADGVQWVALVPEAADGDFSAVRLGFRGAELVRLELDDRLGQQTRVAFANVVRNPSLPAATFQFSAPAGADVVDESAL